MPDEDADHDQKDVVGHLVWVDIDPPQPQPELSRNTFGTGKGGFENLFFPGGSLDQVCGPC